MNTRKIALITGGAKRIGKEISLHLANAGWDIAVQYNKSENQVKEIFDKLPIGVRIYPIQADFRNAAETEKIINKIAQEFGEISLLINNASSFENDNFKNFTVDSFNHNMSVNFTSPAILIRDFFKQKFFENKNYGNIINILDCTVFSYPKEFYSYNLSKKALKNLTKSNASLLAPYIRINAIAPGYVLEGENQKSFQGAVLDSPLQIATPISDILAAIDFILNAKSLTGQIITLDSGINSKKTKLS